jgi:hypothetical protein
MTERIRSQSRTVADHIASDAEAQAFLNDWTLSNKLTMTQAQLHPDWITSRQPDAEDADADGDVFIPQTGDEAPSKSNLQNWQHWSLVVPGQPWWSKEAASTPTPAPAPGRKVVQISAFSRNQASVMHALCNDGTMWQIAAGSPIWTQIPPIPQPGDQ